MSAIVRDTGIIPAYAGNTDQARLHIQRDGDHPRVCGEHYERDRLSGNAVGIIPAYAGNTLRDYSNFVVSKFMSFVFHLV